MVPNFDNTEIAFRYRSTSALRQAQFLFSTMGSPVLTNIGLKMTSLALSLHLPIEGIIKKTIFRQFCGGTTIQEAAATAEVLGKYGVGVILDYGAEGKEGESEFDKAVPEFIKAIEYAATQPRIPFISVKVTGFARFTLLEKMHAGTSLSAQEEEEANRVRARVNAICEAASRTNVMVLIDAEESWIQQPVDDLADSMMSTYNRNGAVTVFNTFQLYRHDRLLFLKQSHEAANAAGYTLGAKLVRGAYMEKERKRAAEMNYQDPIQPTKAAADIDYDEAVQYCLEHLGEISVFIGTHNERSCQLAAGFMEANYIPAAHQHVWFSQLYGMSDNISFNLASAGYQVAKYLPYGPVRDVVPYLMRRAQENTSVAGQTGRELVLLNKEMKRRSAKK